MRTRERRESKSCTLHPVCCEFVGGEVRGEYEEDSISPIVNVLLKKKKKKDVMKS